jgi:hypothetical protein
MEAYLEKKSMYLAGTTLLRNRVLHHLIETMMGELTIEMNEALRNCKKIAPEQFSPLQADLSKRIYGYISAFREADTEVKHSKTTEDPGL